MRIFLLEDDDAIAIGLKYSLENEGYQVTVARTVKDAMQQISENAFSFYILDLSLPDGSGYDVCKKVKSMGDYPVIFLTVLDDEVNVVMGLDLGADDYITKPFRVKELLARMKSVLRRYSKETVDGIIRYKELEVNTNTAKVYKRKEEVELTAMEYRLLLILLNNKGIVLSRNNLLENIWDVDGNFVNDNTLTVYVKRLRNKIEEDPMNPVYIKTVRGKGYIVEHES
ncbi:response regulator transcription factor [Clostridium sp. C105KSO13]|uniref:response regulator transcription factor n=1 Tax=Clostridium sp. C105KSO13 TaxID=1776045 RepID=UPI0007407BF0|nr:response regulator transcription factor [Clostridium sp. C105KSO13]CUX31499.1 Sensory transduction protein regX3 [Clostridium sp. C105KSO13]